MAAIPQSGVSLRGRVNATATVCFRDGESDTFSLTHAKKTRIIVV